MIANLTPEQIGVALVAALVAAFVRGLAGFGMALLLVPILGLAIAPQSAVITATILGLLIGLVGLRKIIGHSEASAKPIALLAIVFTPVGLLLLRWSDPDLARVLIAFVALGAFVMVLLPQRAASHVPSKVETGFTGIASGVLTGFAGMPGPPVIPYYLRRPITPQTARASMMAVFLCTSISGCLAAWALGMTGLREAILALALYPAVLLGNWLGSLAFGRIEPIVWRLFTGTVLGAAALIAVWKLFQP